MDRTLPKSLLRKQNEIDFIESHFRILHHLKIVQILYYQTSELLTHLGQLPMYLVILSVLSCFVFSQDLRILLCM